MRLALGILLLIALPAWWWYLIDKPFLVYMYGLIGEGALACYLIATSEDAR